MCLLALWLLNDMDIASLLGWGRPVRKLSHIFYMGSLGASRVLLFALPAWIRPMIATVIIGRWQLRIRLCSMLLVCIPDIMAVG